MDANFSLLPVVALVTIQRPHRALGARLALLLEEGVECSCVEETEVGVHVRIALMNIYQPLTAARGA